jgi:hypothetical protein
MYAILWTIKLSYVLCLMSQWIKVPRAGAARRRGASPGWRMGAVPSVRMCAQCRGPTQSKGRPPRQKTTGPPSVGVGQKANDLLLEKTQVTETTDINGQDNLDGAGITDTGSMTTMGQSLREAQRPTRSLVTPKNICAYVCAHSAVDQRSLREGHPNRKPLVLQAWGLGRRLTTFSWKKLKLQKGSPIPEV